MEHLTRNVQGQILGVHHTFDKTETVGQQVGALVHNFDAAAIERQALFKVFGIVVVIRLFGDIQQRLIAGSALCLLVNDAQGLVIGEEFFIVKFIVFFLGDFAFVLLPKRYHTVNGFVLGIGFVFPLFSAFFRAGVLHIHLNRETDIVGILFHKRGNRVCFQIFVIIRFFGAGF